MEHIADAGAAGSCRTDLFAPEMFSEATPYPSFNVKDLDTVDRGVEKHLIPSLQRPQEVRKRSRVCLAARRHVKFILVR